MENKTHSQCPHCGSEQELVTLSGKMQYLCGWEENMYDAQTRCCIEIQKKNNFYLDGLESDLKLQKANKKISLLEEEIKELELSCKQKDAAIQVLQDIIADHTSIPKVIIPMLGREFPEIVQSEITPCIKDSRANVLDELTKQAQELNMGY
jgi:hypothetical protein